VAASSVAPAISGGVVYLWRHAPPDMATRRSAETYGTLFAAVPLSEPDGVATSFLSLLALRCLGIRSICAPLCAALLRASHSRLSRLYFYNYLSAIS